MTLKETCRRFHFKRETLLSFEKNGLLKGRTSKDGAMNYQERDLRRTSQLYFLTKAGMDLETLKHFVELLERETNTTTEQI